MGRFVKAVVAVLAAASASWLVAAPIASAAPGRKGKIVRIERPRLVASHKVRMCFKQSNTKEAVLCLGRPPPGDGATIEFFDLSKHIGRAKVTRSGPSAEDSCGSNAISDVYYEFVSGGVHRSSGLLIGLMGVPVVEGARVMLDVRKYKPPNARAKEEPSLGFDTDADGRVDFLFTFYLCTDTVPVMTRPSGAKSTARCISYWSLQADEWVRLSEDTYYDCR